jgi:uracil-DNA glycosylase family 4
MDDARERLRRYLEQRREMGEAELVLDGMTVEDVMRIVGAGAGKRRPTKETERPLQKERAADVPPPAPEAPLDWREALRAAGADAGADADAVGEDAARRGESGAGAEEMPKAKGVPDKASAKSAAVERSAAPTAATAGAPAATPGAVAPEGLIVGAIGGELFRGATAELASLGDIAEAVRLCQRCRLFKTATHGVPGEGNPNAELVCVGEAPGATEDETGRPFVGQAGQLLTKILAAINLSREDVFICNVIKHRPPANRNPATDEIAACSPYLIRQLELIRPKVILALGTFAAQTLLETKLTIGKLRGQVHRYHGIPLVVTYHPAALLRNEAWKRPTWEDVKLARRILDSASGA